MYQILSNLSVKVDAEYDPLIEASSLTYFDSLRRNIKSDFPHAQDVDILNPERLKSSIEYTCIIAIAFELAEAYAKAVAIVQGTDYLVRAGKKTAREQHSVDVEIIAASSGNISFDELHPPQESNFISRLLNWFTHPSWAVFVLVVLLVIFDRYFPTQSHDLHDPRISSWDDKLVIIVPNNRDGPTSVRSLDDKPVEVIIEDGKTDD